LAAGAEKRLWLAHNWLQKGLSFLWQYGFRLLDSRPLAGKAILQKKDFVISIRRKVPFLLTVTAKKKVTKKRVARPVSSGMATAAAILGQPMTKSRGRKNGETVKVKPEWQRFYNRLLELREQLLLQMDGLAKESAQEMPGYSLHMADSGTDNCDRDFALSLLSSDKDAVYEIEEALKRIERRTYGVCELTGKSIPKARLEAIPWTRFTVEAQAQLEREGSLRQRRLGTLGSIDTSAVPDIEREEESDEKSASKEKE
jgi:RNA polymerase-binding transcription factor DksA